MKEEENKDTWKHIRRCSRKLVDLERGCLVKRFSNRGTDKNTGCVSVGAEPTQQSNSQRSVLG